MEKTKVKILGLSFDYQSGGDAAQLVQYALKAAEKFGSKVSRAADVETEFLDTADKNVRFCLGCGKRWEMTDRGCIIRNDYMARVIVPKLGEADGLIFGSPAFGLTTTSRWRKVIERFGAAIWKGYLTNKPAAAITVAPSLAAGAEASLCEMLRNTGAEMMPVTWPAGLYALKGSAGGAGHDTGSEEKGNGYARWHAALNGQRVTEFAIMIKLAKRQLGEAYTREFMQVYHPHYGKESWAWTRLDKEEEEFIQNLKPPKKHAA